MVRANDNLVTEIFLCCIGRKGNIARLDEVPRDGRLPLVLGRVGFPTQKPKASAPRLSGGLAGRSVPRAWPFGALGEPTGKPAFSETNPALRS